jgi:hypothetical protein
MMPPLETTPEARRLVYGLLITLAAGLTLGRLMSAERLSEPSVHRRDDDKVTPRPAWPKARPEPWPTFSSNDRSRWAAVRALVDEGTWVIGRRDPATGADSGIIFEDGFQSVDKVLHPERLEFYSTKPPLLTVLAAGGYWALKKTFGLSIVEDRFVVIRTLLVVFNLVPLVLYLWLLSRLAERCGGSDWGRYFIVGAAGFGTLVTPFLVSLNNHTVAAAAVTVAVYAVVRAREGGGAGWFVLAGLASAFAACNDLPSLALVGALGAYLLWLAPARALVCFVPAVLVLGAIEVGLDYAQTGEVVPVYTKFGGPWYEYQGSHWRVPEGTTKRGIDFARRNGETRAEYAFHLLLGHHGWFSLMPIMLLALPGMAWGLASGGREPSEAPATRGFHAPRSPLAPLALCTLVVSAVVIGFYLVKSDNYGGWSNGPRWLMWLTPLWLLCMLPTLDRLAPSRVGRGVALSLLALSVLSMSYQMWNPWRHPWLYNLLEAYGWKAY